MAEPQHAPAAEPRWLGPGSAEVSGPSSLDYEDEHTGPVTGAVTTAESAPRFGPGRYTYAPVVAEQEGGPHAA